METKTIELRKYGIKCANRVTQQHDMSPDGMAPNIHSQTIGFELTCSAMPHEAVLFLHADQYGIMQLPEHGCVFPICIMDGRTVLMSGHVLIPSFSLDFSTGCTEIEMRSVGTFTLNGKEYAYPIGLYPVAIPSHEEPAESRDVPQVAPAPTAEKVHFCRCCEKEFPLSELTYGPDPFSSEVNGDDTPVFLCSSCWRIRKDDI